MSGLEVLGAFASAVQLASTCLEITAFAIDLFSRVRGTPEAVKKRIAEIEQLIQITRLIEHNPSLQTTLIASVLSTCHGDAAQLLQILRKIDTQAPAGKVVKYWKALEGVIKERTILAICGRLQEKKASLTLCIASINVDLLHEIDIELVTVRQGVSDTVQVLPAIRDTARKVTTIFDELPITAAKVSTLHNELPAISGKITAIHDDMPALASKVTLIQDELPSIRDALERLALSQQAHVVEPISVSSGQSHSLMPFTRDEDFISRDDIIQEIDRIFSVPNTIRRVALTGLGGVGKTQIAIEYTYRLWERSPNTRIFWVHAGSRIRFEQSYRSIANVAKLPGAEDPKADILGMVSRWLENGIDGQWFMVLDNADDATVFSTQTIPGCETSGQTESRTTMSLYLPRSKGSILITSRNSDVAIQLTGRPQHVLKIDELGKDDAVKLLQKKLPTDHSEEIHLNELVDALERLPLAITQAAAYIAMRSPRMSISKYLEFLRRDEVSQISLLSKDGGDLRRDPEVPNAVVLTWQISFSQIKRQNAFAATLLARMSVLERQGIPRFLIHQDDDGDDLEFEDAIGVLLGFSFVRTQADGDSFEMHPLVQLSTKKWLEVHGEIQQRKEEALRLLSQKLPTGEYQNWQVCETLDPHVQVVLRYDYLPRLCKLERAEVLHNSADFALARGNYEMAVKRAQEAASARKEALGFDDPATLDSHNLLAVTYANEGRWKEAEELNSQVMETRKRVSGPEHPSTLTSMANLASTFWNQGRWKEAEELEAQVVETRKRVLGPEHPSTLTSMANLASTYRNQRRWKEAEELFAQVVETRKRVLGPEHPSTLTSMANLAYTWENQGQQTEAVTLLEDFVRLRRQVLGPDHPFTMSSLTALNEWKKE